MLVPEMITTRLAFSVTMSAHRVHLRPDDPYMLVSEKPAWATLELIDELRQPIWLAANSVDSPPRSLLCCLLGVPEIGAN